MADGRRRARSAIIAVVRRTPKLRRKAMDRETVLRHLRAWADGVDPASGQVLPSDHPGQRPETLRVIFAAVALLDAAADTAMQPPARGFAPGPRNAGRPWSNDDDEALAGGFDAGETIGALASKLERTRGAISARLVKLGKIEAPPGLRLRGSSAFETHGSA
jgi:hypothetical protein